MTFSFLGLFHHTHSNTFFYSKTIELLFYSFSIVLL